ncbi:MAG: hypothetical protein QM802_23015 [Agriterribacter sp.]
MIFSFSNTGSYIHYPAKLIAEGYPLLYVYLFPRGGEYSTIQMLSVRVYGENNEWKSKLFASCILAGNKKITALEK